MPTYAEVTNIINGELDTNWSNSPITYDNVESLDYSLANNPLIESGTSPYVRTEVNFVETQMAEVGINGLKRTWGYLHAYFYSPKDSGTKSNLDNLDLLIPLFEYKQIQTVTFKEANLLPSFTEGSWYVTPVMVRFYFTR